MSAACRGGTARTLGAPFVNNQIDPALYNPIALKMMSMLPLPDPALDPDGCGRYVLQIPNDSDEQQYIGRMDYQATSNKRVFGRVFYTKYLPRPGLRPGQPEPAAAERQRPRHRRPHDDAGERLRLGRLAARSSRRRASRCSTPRRERIQGDGAPTWTSLGVKTFQYTTGGGQDFLAGGTAGLERQRLHRPVLRLHAVGRRRTSTGSRDRTASRSAACGRARTPTVTAPSQSNGTMGFSGLITSGTNNANGGLPLADFVLGLPATFNQAGSQSEQPVDQRHRPLLRRRLARQPQPDAELRHPLGAVPRRHGRQRLPGRPSAARTSTRASSSVVYPERAGRPDVQGRSGLPGQRIEQQQPPRAVRAARRHRLGSEGQQRADDPRRHRSLLRFAEAVGLRAPPAEPAVRQPRERARAGHLRRSRTATAAPSTSPTRGRRRRAAIR